MAFESGCEAGVDRVTVRTCYVNRAESGRGFKPQVRGRAVDFREYLPYSREDQELLVTIAKSLTLLLERTPDTAVTLTPNVPRLLAG